MSESRPTSRSGVLTSEETTAKILAEFDERLWKTANDDIQLRLFSRYEAEAVRGALAALSENRERQAPEGMRWLLVEDTPPLKERDMHDHGALFGLRFVDGCSNGCAEIYVEDDENWHFKMRFDRVWLDDLFSLLLSEREHRK